MYIRKNRHEIEPCGTFKKTKNNKIIGGILTLPHFLAEVIYMLHRIKA